MTNTDIRNYAKLKGVKLWRIAEELKITDSTFSRQLRKEFANEKKQEIIAIIDKLAIIKNTDSGN